MDLGSVIGGGGLVTLILAVGGGVKWWVGRKDAQKDPIPKDQAAVALSASAVEVSQAVLTEVRAEMSEMRRELATERNYRHTLEKRVAAAEGTIEHHESMFSAAMGYIESLLRHIRAGLAQPAPPVPRDLTELIDPSLYD